MTDRVSTLAVVLLRNPTARHYGYDLSTETGVAQPIVLRVLTRLITAGWLVDGDLVRRRRAAVFRRQRVRVLLEDVHDLAVQGSVFTLCQLFNCGVKVVGQAETDLLHRPSLMLEWHHV